jgi:hypothetical protein
MTDKKYRSFKKAREFVRSLELKNRYEWVVLSQITKGLPEDIPVHPDEVYKKQFIDWRDWIGGGSKSGFWEFEKAREFVRNLNLKSTADWKVYCSWDPNEIGLKPDYIPASPHVYYKDSGWIGYGDWIGTNKLAPFQREYRPFEEAREFTRALGLTSTETWIDYCKGKYPNLPQKPDDIPTNVARKYLNRGWMGMDDFLNGKHHRKIYRVENARDFEEARSFVHTLKLKNLKAWHKYVKSELKNLPAKPDDIPNSPELVYKEFGWKGYGDWLGTYTIAPFKRTYRPFKEAREFARQLGLTSSDKWIKYCRGDFKELPVKPKDIPTNVARKYEKDWVSYKDFLMSEVHRKNYSKFRTYENARTFMHQLGLKNYQDWKDYLAGKFTELPAKPKDIPSNPAGVYKNKGWTGIGDWLGTNAFPYAHHNYVGYKEAREFSRNLGLTSSVEWVQYCKDELDWLDPKPANIPANVVRKYEGNGWKGFKDFLHSDKHRKHIKSFMKYREAKALIVGLGIKSEAEYLDYAQGKLVDKYGKAPKNLPENPRVIYRRQGWKSFKEFIA